MSGPVRDLPAGTLVFLRTDIEGSIRLSRRLGAGYDPVHARHQELIRGAVRAHGGTEVRTEGDAFFVVFQDARAAAAAAVDLQRAMVSEPWPEDAAPSVRVGLHAGAAHHAGDDYGGIEVARAARIAGAGAGGQIVLSEAVRVLLDGSLPTDQSLRDLGLHRLRDLERPERLFQLEARGLPTDFPIPRTAAEIPVHLPTRATSFVGRDTELEVLAAMLADTRLVTLTGPGGTGKTSLAVEAARRVAPRFPDGTWFVDLQAVSDAGEVPQAIARTLGLHDGPAGPAADRLPDHLRDRELLLVLDNLEHLLPAAPTIAQLLAAAPRVRMIATSRAALRIGAEQELPVRPLPLPEPASADASSAEGPMGADARRLFLERARRAAPSLTLAGDAAATVDAICRSLDGLPLAIELAAARCGALPLRVIRDRLDARLPLPGATLRDLPERQRTLEATIDWSMALLPDPVRRLLARVAVFEGAFDLEQAERVCGPADELGIDVLDGLISLTEHSLLERVPDAGQGMRFRLLETIRAFALDRLRASGELSALRARHAEAYLALAEGFAARVSTWEQGSWIDRLAADHANLRATMDWALEAREAAFGLRLMGAAWRYWMAAGELLHARAWVGAVLALPGADAPTPERITGLDGAGGLAYWGSDMAMADACYREQLTLAQQIGGPADVANAAFNLSHTGYVMGDQARGMEAVGIAAEAFAQVGDVRGLARLDMGRLLGTVFELGPGSGFEEMVPIHDRLRAANDLLFAGVAAGSLAWFAMNDGDPRRALRWSVTTFRYQQALKDRAGGAIALASVASFLLAIGRAEDAARMMGAFDALCGRYGVRPPVDLQRLVNVARPDLGARTILGDGRYDELYAEGERMTMDHVVALIERVASEEGIDVPD